MNGDTFVRRVLVSRIDYGAMWRDAYEMTDDEIDAEIFDVEQAIMRRRNLASFASSVPTSVN